jgi:hypothetical protein
LLMTPVSYSIFDDWSQGRFFRRRRAKEKSVVSAGDAPLPVPATPRTAS